MYVFSIKLNKVLNAGEAQDTTTLQRDQNQRHFPLVTFLRKDPTAADFEPEVRELQIFSPFSDMRKAQERSDLKHRFIDPSTDNSYSLYRCLSKEIFGTERHFDTLVEAVAEEVRSNPSHYGKINEFRPADAFKDLFTFQSTIEKENAEFFAERIEDGLNLNDLELLAVSTYFQTPIFVLTTGSNGSFKWKEVTTTRRIKKPKNLKNRKYQSRCEPMTYFVTLFRTSWGQYHRIIPRHDFCNCVLQTPTNEQVPTEPDQEGTHSRLLI